MSSHPDQCSILQQGVSSVHALHSQQDVHFDAPLTFVSKDAHCRYARWMVSTDGEASTQKLVPSMLHSSWSGTHKVLLYSSARDLMATRDGRWPDLH